MDFSRCRRAPYRGQSMTGTFTEGDLLWIQPLPTSALQPGDIVAFRADSRLIAHRVITQKGQLLITQGDGCWRPDAAPLEESQVIGRVVARCRRGVLRPVAGGRRGRWRGRLLHLWTAVREGILVMLAPAYHLVRASRIARFFWRPPVDIVRFFQDRNPVVKYVHHRRTVACWEPDKKRWSCRRPFDLILQRPPP